MNDNLTYDAFLSHNSSDHDIVEQVARELERRGCSCFIDRWYLERTRRP